MKFRTATIISAAILLCSAAYADNYVVIGKETKVFETPVAKDEFAAVNSADKPVLLQLGMAFKIEEEKGGWYVVEYTPGLRGMVMLNVVADTSTLKTPAPGDYTVSNNPSEKVKVSSASGAWSLGSGSGNFSGTLCGNVVVFKDANGATKYTLVNLQGTPRLFNYDNSVTRFF